jgi:P27 family predicted phage terminase small subunit
MKGRPPKPTHLRAIEGNKGKRSTDTQEPEPPLVIEYDPPQRLRGAARDLWLQLIVELGKFVGIRTTDLTKLELLCEAFGRYREAQASLYVREKDPVSGADITVYRTTYVSQGRNGKQIKTRPEYHQMLEEARLFHSLSAEFGMSPAMRARLKGFGQRDLWDNEGDALDQLEKEYGQARPGAVD